jgi:two-component system, OmpR family, phosphate regulon sensor histidine kinase PhoR
LKFAGRLVLGTILVVVFVVLTIVSASEVSLRRDLEADISSALEREARLVANALPPDSAGWEATVKRLGAESGLRITLIDSVGRVRAESDVPEERVPIIENHANRPEVIAALKSGVGSNKRLSATIGEPLLYVAVRGGPGIVRVAARIPQVDRVVKRAQHSVLGAALLALVVGCILATIAARSVARPLTQITGAARAIAQGAPPRFPRSTIPDVNALVRALREMNNQFGERYEALRVGKAESVAIVEAMAEGVIAADNKGHVVIANAAARRLLGYEAEAQLPELAQLFRAKAARDVVSAVLAGMTSGGRELDLGDCVVMLSGRPLPGGGALLVLHDVTEIRRLETVRRDFVANVSHELKTPLTSISGYAETLVVDQPDPATTKRFLEVILANARRMHRLVDGLLDLSKIESGGWHPAVEPLDGAAVVRETWGLFAERATAQKISFVPQFDGKAGTLQADPDALRQILTNLFDNALRYTQPGGRITVKLAPDEGGVRLSVGDNGSGITSEHLPRIFERFYRADPARSREEGGTGLGLAIVKHLVEAHGGSVEAQSQWGQGTTISIWFPAPAEIRSSPDRDPLIASM